MGSLLSRLLSVRDFNIMDHLTGCEEVRARSRIPVAMQGEVNEYLIIRHFVDSGQRRSILPDPDVPVIA